MKTHADREPQTGRQAASAQQEARKAAQPGPAAADNARDTAQRLRMTAAFGPGVAQKAAQEEDMLQGRFAAAQRVEEEEPLQGRFAVTQKVEEEEPLQGKFALAQRVEEEEALQGKFPVAQKVEEEEPLQGQFAVAQKVEDEEPLQGQFGPAQLRDAPTAKTNDTGLPDQLKAGVESLSGISMDHVKVHYNSPQPAQLNALAYAAGSDIHVAPGQEQHLPHEAWHIAQQAQGRVQPTTQMQGGVAVNDDKALEHEADVMGAKAQQMPFAAPAAAAGALALKEAPGAATTQRQQAIATRTPMINAVTNAIALLQQGTSAQATRAEVLAHDQAMSPGQHHAFRQVLRTALIGDLQQRLDDQNGYNARDNGQLQTELGKKKPNAGKVTQL